MTTPNDRRTLTQIKQYQLVRQIGRGGMGTVYEAVDGRDNTHVAVKLLHPWLAAEDPSYRERFEREAHIAALLRSPYTVRLLDFGVADGSYFLVMEYVEGRSLDDELAEGPLEPARALRIGIDVARALEEAGARGVVHRDIKPANVLLTEDGRVKVTDFGIARQEGGAGLTSAGRFVGTAEFAAPEQVAGEADHRTDVYAMGGVLFCMLAGHPPFQAASVWELLRMQQAEQPPFEELAQLPSLVVNPIRRCLEKDPRDRYQTAAELAGALERALAGLARVTGSGAARGPATTPPAPAATAPPVAPPSAGRGSPSGAGAATLAGGFPSPGAGSPAPAGPETAPPPAPTYVAPAGTSAGPQPASTRVAPLPAVGPRPLPAPASVPPRQGSRPRVLLIAAIGGVVALAAIVGVVLALSRGDSKEAGPLATPTGTAVSQSTTAAATTVSATAATGTAEPAGGAAPPETPTATPTAPPPPRSINAGEWWYAFTVESNSCADGPAVGQSFDFAYYYEEVHQPPDGFISEGELFRLTHLGGTYVANLVFRWPTLIFDYPIDGGHAYVGSTFDSEGHGTGTLTETYDLDGGSTCSVFLRDPG
ncbi:MAG: serine/threonine protein kinase [Gemmataceae bacterium]|nr:serine/threonine protein kinase [Gemmataceae bacterium]